MNIRCDKCGDTFEPIQTETTCLWCLKKDEPAHYMKSERYWRQFLKCPDGRYVVGRGFTPNEAFINASEKRNEVEKFLSQSPLQQLEELTKNEDICWRDMQKVVKIIADILLKKVK